MAIKVLLVDDHLVVLQGLRLFLGTQKEIHIVGEAINGKQALEKVEQLQPDIVLMDLIMPVMNGIEATREMTKRYPHVKVIVLTSFSDQDHVLPAIKAGAVGYQLKDIEPDELVKTIIDTYEGRQQLHPTATHLLLSHVAIKKSNEKEFHRSPLTKREEEVLYQITLGRSNRGIANVLSITEKTVKTHVSSILSKLHMKDRTQEAIYAITNDIFKKVK